MKWRSKSTNCSKNLFNAGCKPRNAKVPLIQKPHEKGQWRWLIDVRVLWSQPVGGWVEGYSWLDVRGPSHTYIQPQSSAALKCVCVCIHNTRNLVKTVTVLSTFLLILYFLSILSSLHQRAVLTKPVVYQCLVFLPHPPFSLLSYKVFWLQQIAAGFSILSSLCKSSPSYCLSPTYCTLPPGQSQLSSTLRNTPAYYTNTQMQAHTQALTCALTNVRTRT